jgi:hypothetical protein
MFTPVLVLRKCDSTRNRKLSRYISSTGTPLTTLCPPADPSHMAIEEDITAPLKSYLGKFSETGLEFV